MDLPSFSLSFRYRNAVQIWAALFQLVERVFTPVGTVMNCFSNVPNAALVISSKSTLLIILSLAFPVITAAIVGVLGVLTLTKKVEELRSNFFLSSIEGHRLNSIELFRELSLNAFALKTHVSRLAASAPASANLQTRHTIGLLKFFALFEIVSKDPQADSQEWYIKSRRYKFSLIETIKNSLRQLCSCFTEYGPDGQDYAPLSSSDDQKSFHHLFFKKVVTKLARRLEFPDDTLNNLKSCAANAEQFEDSEKKRDRLHKWNSDDDGPYHFRVKVLPDFFNKKRSSVTVSVLPVSVLPSQQLDFSALQRGVGFSIQLTENKSPFPMEGNRRFVISKVTDVSTDNAATPGAAAGSNFQHSKIHVEFECLDATAYADFDSFKANMELDLSIDNPFIIDDDTIDWFKNSEMLDSHDVKRLISHVITENKKDANNNSIRMQTLSARSDSLDPKEPAIRTQNSEEPTFDFKNQYVLRFNPYKHRSLLVLAAIFFDSAEAYRCIVGATGVEFFMDLLVVNGSANIKKW